MLRALFVGMCVVPVDCNWVFWRCINVFIVVCSRRFIDTSRPFVCFFSIFKKHVHTVGSTSLENDVGIDSISTRIDFLKEVRFL